MQNNNIETVAAPVGTVRKFVSQQYLSDYKTSTLDTAYATKSIATTSANGLMSKEDKQKLDSISAISGNSSRTIVIGKTGWTYENGMYYTDVTLNVNNEILYMGAYDTDSNESVFLSYKKISNTSLKLSATKAMNLRLTIVFEGEVINKDTTVIDDSVTSLTSTWSSDKILKKIEQLPANSQFSVTIPSDSWKKDGLLVSTTITHNINKKILYIGAYDSATKQSLFTSYVMIDNNSIKISIEEKLDAVITIVFEGNIINLAGGDISDSTTSLVTTWSSTKIQATLPKVATSTEDGLISSADKVVLDSLSSKMNLINTISNKLDKSSITFSTKDPSGGKHGDIWFKYSE